jgi:hypothetical protein
MRFYKQLNYWQGKIGIEHASAPDAYRNKRKENLTVEEEERQLKRLRVTGEEMGVIKKLIGKRIETMCGEWAMIDLGKLFSFCSQ